MFSMDLGQDVAFINLRQALNDLLIRVNREDCALADSGIISAATDNAKELILAKINATPELVDIYTYLLSIGTPFKAIADIMSSRAFNAITKIGESNIFDESTHGFRVKDMIGFYTGDNIPNAIKFGLQPALGYIPSNEQCDKAIEQLNTDIAAQERANGALKDYIIQGKRNAIKLYELIKFRNDS